MESKESTILIVDDDAADLQLVERTLGSLGHNILTVRDPHEVIDQLFKHRPKVIIMDALLPGLSGLDLCKQIKTNVELKGTQVLILTGLYLRKKYQNEARQRFKADYFMRKPFRPHELRRVVLKLFSKSTERSPSSFLRYLSLLMPVTRREEVGFFSRLLGKNHSLSSTASRSILGVSNLRPIAKVDLSLEKADALDNPSTETLSRTSDFASVETTSSLSSAPYNLEGACNEEAVLEVPQIVTIPDADLLGLPFQEIQPQDTVVETEVSVTSLQSSPAAGLGKASSSLFNYQDTTIYEEESFVAELNRALSKCHRVERPLTLILIKVVDLQQIVELYGAHCKELVLRHVAEQAVSSLRKVDLVGMMRSENLIAISAFASGRYGGSRIVARLRRALKKQHLIIGEGLSAVIPELQFGMATFPSDGGNVTDIMKKAREEITASS